MSAVRRPETGSPRRHRAAGTTIAALALTWAVFGVASAATAESSSDAPPTITYAPDPTPALLNPERGLYSGTNSLADIGKSFIEHAQAGPYSIVHGYVDLSKWTTAAIPDGDLQVLSQQLDSAFGLLRDGGLKVILRFSYSPAGASMCGGGVNPSLGAKPAIPPDAPLAVIEAHIVQLAPIVDEHSALISSMEAGFLGEFGEWHCSVNSPESPPSNAHHIPDEAKSTVLALEAQYFPVDRQIELRYPRDILALSPDYSNPASRIGNHQDCYASSDPTDEGTWDPADIAAEKQAIADLGLDHVVGGTVCGISDRVTCDIALQEMPMMHFSYLTGEYYEPALNLYKNPQTGQPCWDEITARLGYRLQLNTAVLPTDVAPGSTAQVNVTLTNLGFASMFNERPVMLTLGTGDDFSSFPLAIDPRSWKSGQQSIISAELPIPADLPSGEYDVGIWLPDSEDDLRAIPAYSVRFANTGTWDADTGINVLGTLAVVSEAPQPSAAATPYLAASGFSTTNIFWAASFAVLASVAGVCALTVGARLFPARGRR